MTMSYLEMLNAVKNDADAGKSKFNYRNEKKQEKVKGGRIPKLDKNKDEVVKLLFPLDLALPFNPLTGEADDKYNSETKFRLEQTPSYTIKMLKTHFNNPANAEAKKKFMEMMRIEEWDVSEPETITKADKEIFDDYRVPKIFSYDMMYIKSEVLNRVKFPVPYRVTFKRDELGDVITENGESYPEILNLYYFFNSVFLEEYNSKIDDTMLDDAKKKIFKECMEKNPISLDDVRNFGYFMEFKLDSDMRVPSKEVDGKVVVDSKILTEEVLTKSMRRNTLSAKGNLKIDIDNIRGKHKKVRDKYLDFYEIDMSVGGEDDDMERAKNAKFQGPLVALDTYENADEFEEAISKAFDAFDKQEEKMTSSVAKKVLTDDVVKNLTNVLAKEVPLESIEKYISGDIADRYAYQISSIYGDLADDLLAEADCGELNDGTVTEEQRKLAEVDIRAMANADAEVEMEEIDEIEIVD